MSARPDGDRQKHLHKAKTRARLSAALRENLKRRKAQARNRSANEAPRSAAEQPRSAADRPDAGAQTHDSAGIAEHKPRD